MHLVLFTIPMQVLFMGVFVMIFLVNKLPNNILTNVFIYFWKELKSKECITEGVFICLYRISRKMVYENCNRTALVFREQTVTGNFYPMELSV